jgi:hypothetical protein
MLAGAFGLITIALQYLFLARTHEESSNVAYVISASAIAVLLEPVRRRMQDLVDSRLFRKEGRHRNDRKGQLTGKEY